MFLGMIGTIEYMFLLTRAMKILYHPNVCPFTQQMVCMLDCFLHTYHSFACSESLHPRRTSQTAEKSKLEQLPPMEKKPSLPDIKLKMEFSPKKEPGATKTEPMWEVEEEDN